MKKRKFGELGRRPDPGFSLIEMLIAVTLVAVMAVALWAVLRISISSWSRGSEEIDANQRHRSILDLVKKQMASIYGLIAPVDPQAASAIYPIFVGNPTSVRFVSLNSMRFQDNPGLTMVAYDVVADREGGYSLTEREQQYLGLDDGSDSLFGREDRGSTRIFDNLDSFAFEYFDLGGGDLPARWVKEWNGRLSGRLPGAISMTMVSRDARAGLLNRQVVIPILAKPYDQRLNFVNPFESRPRRLNENDPRFIR
jgi:general secretion pathway protein J